MARAKGLYVRLLKRPLDLGAASLGLLFVSPLLAIVWGLVRWRLGAPVLFRQNRPGRGGKTFQLLKFRTMTEARGPDGELLPDADRLTHLGRFLRRTSLDELPELFNVLRGEMSLVGPRPLLMRYLPLYSSEQARRHETRPGITGWAQVNGRNSISWDEKFALDVWYVDHLSLLVDLAVLVRTIGKVLTRQGVDFQGQEEMPYFQGSGVHHASGLPGRTKSEN